MTQRDRQPTGTASEATPQFAQSHASLSSLGTRSPASRSARTPSWEDIYQGATAVEQVRLLALADGQGLLYGRQLPQSAVPAASDKARQFVTRLLNSPTGDLQPVRPTAIDAPELDPGQREAVAKALATPDVCLIQGLPVTGKSRVCAEIVQRAANRGERVLLASTQTANLDRTLDLLQRSEGICAVRCLDRGEKPETLSEMSRSMTFSQLLRQTHERALETAEGQCAESDRRCVELAEDASSWPQLLELAERLEHLGEQSAALARERAAIPESVNAAVARLLVCIDRDGGASTGSGTTSLGVERHFEACILAGVRSLGETQARTDAALAQLGQRIDQSKEVLGGLSAEQDRLAPLAEAKAGRKWWTSAWWKATFRGDVSAEASALEARVREAKEALETLEEEASRLTTERRQAEEQARAEQGARIESEVARRQGELAAREAALAGERGVLEAKWRDLLATQHECVPTPQRQTVEAVREARAGWQRAIDAAERRRTFAREWGAFLSGGPNVLADQLRSCVNLVAATTAGFPLDENYGESAKNPPAFDLLVVEHAEQVAEAEFLSLARRCRRWVLVADSMAVGLAVEQPSSRQAAEGSNTKARSEGRRNKIHSTGFFLRLWNRLHCEPRRLPYAWERETDSRLCCRLRPVSLEQRRWLETEKVADFPEIELRIVAPPRGSAAPHHDSFLAEVVFPAAVSIQEAKTYIFRELQELPVRAYAHSARWVEQAERFVLQLTDSPEATTQATPVDLAPGVREVLAMHSNGDRPSPDGWFTRAVEFDRCAGWERPQVEEWADRHLGLRDLGRTAVLEAPQGMRPGIAAFLSDTLFAGGYRSSDLRPQGEGARTQAAAVEFVAIPPLPRASARPDQRRPKLPAGHGLEVDLADPRHRDRLPSDVRAALGDARGLVNYMEAQAVVRFLERLVGDPQGLRTTLLHRTGRDLPRNGEHLSGASVGVVALYPAQAKLIRLLLDRNPKAFASCRSHICVDVPAAFAERECSLALVSLTRSHTHRATSFGEGPLALALALTRGRDKLILFGDAGTLSRRAEWQGQLDHLDEANSRHERDIISRLVHYLNGRGKHDQVFRVNSEGFHASVSASGLSAAVRGPSARESSNA